MKEDRGRWEREPTWWKTYDYKSGKTYILGEKFTSKTQAMNYARHCGMIVIPESTRPITDEERRKEIELSELRQEVEW